MLFLGTIDAYLVALDAKTGRVVWEKKAADYQKGYTFTGAPLVVKDKILVGVTGGEYGARGFVDAYVAQSGKLAWRFQTIPGPGEPGNETWSGDSWKTGGAPAWLTGSFDPDLNLVYWGIGNPGPDHWIADRKGDNLYSDSVVALNPDTGKLAWYFQFTPNDAHDYDSTLIPVLLEAEYGGRERKLLAMANRNGFYYLLDRKNGEFLRAKQLTRVTWAKGVDDTGRPILNPEAVPTAEGADVCPGVLGATNWMSPSFSPDTNLFYFTLHEACRRHFGLPQEYEEGQSYWGGAHQIIPGSSEWGALRAIDPLTGETQWEFKYPHTAFAGVLSTASGLVFSGDGDGNFFAADAKGGQTLWHMQTGGSICASPMSFAVDGRQYISIASQNALITFALPQDR
jgi:alcohol dehydrogenase (cytochrome c)